MQSRQEVEDALAPAQVGGNTEAQALVVGNTKAQALAGRNIGCLGSGMWKRWWLAK